MFFAEHFVDVAVLVVDGHFFDVRDHVLDVTGANASVEGDSVIRIVRDETSNVDKFQIIGETGIKQRIGVIRRKFHVSARVALLAVELSDFDER